MRWRGKGEWLLLWCARDRRVLAIVAGDAPSGYAALIRAGRLVSLVDEPHTRRCDAKRAAEVLVGQWWREKCGREAKARAKGLTAVRTFTLPAAFFDATVAVLQEAASE